jgi:replication factor A1
MFLTTLALSFGCHRYEYVDFTQLEGMNKEDAYVDVLAVIHSVDETSTITTKRDSRELTKREITLMDQSQIAIRCTLWGTTAENFAHQVGDIVSIKKAKLSDFHGVSLPHH